MAFRWPAGRIVTINPWTAGWLNDGSGNFTFSSLAFGTENAADVDLGDVDGDGDVDGWNEIAILPGNSTAHDDTGLACDGQYHFRVRAYRESDDLYSTYSNTAETPTGPCRYRVYLAGLIKNLP